MKKILFFGPEITDFLNPLAKKLNDIGHTVDLIENRKIPRNNNSITQSYSTVLNYHEIIGAKATVGDIIKYVLKWEFIHKYFKEIIIDCLEGQCRIIRSFKNYLNHRILNERFSPVFSQYDIINFHSLSIETLSFINYISKDTKIILSFWGSDLYQTSGLNNYYLQSATLKRADIITVFNYEMEMVVLSKFGFKLKSKIVHACLGIDDEIFDLMDRDKEERPNLNFLQKYNIPENKIKITVSYSGNPVCNHLLILHELGKIENKIKEKLHLLVPMTYGNFTKEYMKEVLIALDNAKISYTLFDKFLSLDELAKSKVNSDIMIQMNKSDGFSTSVREALYADNILISAVWLPYSILRLENKFFYETDFTKLSETVTFIIDNYEMIKQNLKGNSSKAKKITAFSQIFQPWINIFESF